MLRFVALISALLSLGAFALPPETATSILTRARSLRSLRYELGGRARAGEGIDCQGLVFRALEAAMTCGYQSFSVLNVNNLRDGEVGRAIPGFAPVSTAQLDVTKLEPGDVIWLVAPIRNPAERAIGQLDGADVWVWHTGLFVGDGRWIVGDHFAGEVVETELIPYLQEHTADYSGVFALRMERGPQPKVCRRPRARDVLTVPH